MHSRGFRTSDHMSGVLNREVPLYTYIHVNVYRSTSVCACLHVSVCVSEHVYACMCVRARVCKCVSGYILKISVWLGGDMIRD